MTTEIVVRANCGKEKEVKIKITGEKEIILQDGQIEEALYVYDDREISVKEVEKTS